MKEYQMTQDQMDKILEACRPIPFIIVGGIGPPSQQQMANSAWCSLGKEMGFDGMSVLPSDKGKLYFTAEKIK